MINIPTLRDALAGDISAYRRSGPVCDYHVMRTRHGYYYVVSVPIGTLDIEVLDHAHIEYAPSLFDSSMSYCIGYINSLIRIDLL